MIRITNLQFGYASQPLLNISDWKVDKGEQLFLYGTSGCGKSTLLQLLAGLLRPTQGSIEINHQRIDQLSARQMDRFRAQHIGFIAQDLNLIPYLNAYDNVLLAAQFSHRHKELNKTQLREKIKALFSQVNITAEQQQQTSSQLSMGQQQRVAIVRGLIHSPELILADEPTSALDLSNRNQFMNLLTGLCETLNTTLLMVSHDLSLRDQFHRHQSLSDFNHVEPR